MKLDYTVTWLEMATRPDAPRRDPPMPGLSVMRAHPPTVHFFRYLYDAVGAPYEWTDLHAESDAEIAAFAQHEAVHLNVAYLDGCPAGFVMLDHRAAPVVEVAFFGLMPEFIGRRLGPWLLLEGIHDAWDAGASTLTVNTCTLDHPGALPLYRRYGFVPVRSEAHSRESTLSAP